MTTAKAIAGGFPMGAVLCADRISPSPGKHGSTFGGNPLACAAALASIGYIEDHDLCRAAMEKGEYFYQALNKSLTRGVREIRQIGLMVGVELKSKSKPVLESLLNRNILAIPAGPTVVRMLPPLVIEYSDLDKVATSLGEAIEENL